MGSNEEGLQGCCQADDQRPGDQDALRAARLEAEGLFRSSYLFRGDRLPRSEKEWYFHSPRALQDQDTHKASHEGGSEEYLWQGGAGCSEASEKSREGLSCRGLEAANLNQLCEEMQDSTSRGSVHVGMPRNRLGRCR